VSLNEIVKRLAAIRIGSWCCRAVGGVDELEFGGAGEHRFGEKGSTRGR
jgi:hypothetical protein